MAWLKIDDHFAEHPKVATAGPLAGWLHVCALCYCNRHLTDGFIPARVVGTLADFSGITDEANGEAKPKQLASILLSVGLWEEADGGYQIHDYLEYNPSRDEVIATREKRAEAGRIGGKRSGTTRNAGNEAESKQNSSNVLSKTASKNEAKSNPVPVPVPVPPVEDSSESSGAQKDDSVNKRSGKTSKPRKQPETFCPEMFPLEDRHYQYGGSKGLTKSEIERETEKFLNWHTAKQTTYGNWQRAWQNWIIKAAEDKEKITPIRQRKPDDEVPGYESWRERKLVL